MGKVFKYGFITIILVFLILLLVPWLFKDEIFKKVKQEASNQLKGELFIEDLSLSLIRDFPNLSLTLDQVRYECDTPFAGITLFDIEHLKAELDLMSVIKGESIDIEGISLTKPKFHVSINKDGLANYLIMKDVEGAEEVEATEGESSFHLAIKKFLLSDFTLTYADKSSDVFTEITKGDFTLKGNFTEEIVSISTLTELEELTLGVGSMNYFDRVSFESDFSMTYNQESGLLTLGDNYVTINKLQLLFEGWLQSFEEKLSLDMNISAPSSDFKEILSLVPIVYLEGFESIQTSGKFSLKGDIAGDYFYKGDNLPAFDLNIGVKDGNFKYPDLPASVSNIEILMDISHDQGSADKTVIDLSKSNMVIAGSPFSASLLLKNPISDPDIDFAIATELNLERFTEVLPIEGNDLKGVLSADARVKGRLSHFENNQFGKVEASGWVKSKKLFLKTTSLKEDISIDTAYLVVTPQKLQLPVLKMKVGESDFSGSGYLQNFLGYALVDDTIQGSFNLYSSFLNVTQLMNAMPDEEDASSSDSEVTVTAPSIPGDLNISISAKADRVLYDDIDIENMKGKLIVQNSVAYLKGFSMDLLQGKLLLDGDYRADSDGIGMYDMDLNLKQIDAKTSFSTFNTVQSFAPVANSAQGKYSTKMKFKGELNKDLGPDLNSLYAKGNLYTLGLLVQPEIMKTVAGILNDSKYEKIRFQDADLSFVIDNGKIEVSPVKLFLGDVAAEFSGTHGLDRSIDYLVKTEVSIKNIKLPPELAALNLVGGTIPVKFKIGGTLDNPTVKPEFGDAASVSDVVNQVINQVVDEVKDSAITVVNKEAEKIMADASAEADAIMKKAEEEAANVKLEAAKQAQKLKEEAQKQADQLIEEAKGNPLKEASAKVAADIAIKDANKRIDKILVDANKNADGIVNAAKVESDKILKEAEEKAKILN